MITDREFDQLRTKVEQMEQMVRQMSDQRTRGSSRNEMAQWDNPRDMYSPPKRTIVMR